MLPVRTLHQLRTRCNADSVEFVPASFGSSAAELRTFVCGNYQLDEATREKAGRIYLYQLRDAEAAAAAAVDASSSSGDAKDASVDVCNAAFPLVEQQVLDTDAIFDLKWCPRVVNDKMMLGQADASGKLLIYEYQHAQDGRNASLTEMLNQQVVEKASCLSLDWNNRLHAQAEPTIAVSQSNSAISLWQLGQGGLQALASWTAHEYEMWIVSFNAHNPHILYSGADDCKFRGWDTRQSNTIRSHLFTDSTHEMGVCSIQSHPTREHVLATGSYDENLRIWDTRAMKSPLLTHALGGGVWRVRWHPSAEAERGDSILVCAMHNGFAVVDLDFGSAVATPAVADLSTQLASTEISSSSDASSSSVVASATSSSSAPISAPTASTVVTYKEHVSLAYGADWCAAPLHAPSLATSSADAPLDLIATCSFYDKQLNVWTVERGAQAAATIVEAAPSA